MFNKRELKCGLFWNGFNENIAHAVAGHMVKCCETLVTVQRPLSKFDRYQETHWIESGGSKALRKSIKIKYPMSLVGDIVAALPVMRSHIAVVFSAHVALVAAIAKRLGMLRGFVYWNIDFSQRRFKSPLVNSLYHLCDRVCVAVSDLHVEVSSEALKQRATRYGYKMTDRHIVVPVGINPQRIAKPDPGGWMRRRIATVGYLRSGLANDVLLDALSILDSRGDHVVLDLIGEGPQLAALKRQAERLKLTNIVFHGAVTEDEKFRILNQTSIGIALYHPGPDNFTQFADPGKLKDYLAVGLPIVMNDVPATTEDYANSGAATVVDLDPQSVADAIISQLDPETYMKRSHASHLMAQRYLWPVILKEFESRLLRLSVRSSQKS
jgi:glycosyltransferase involved in cell wall biosynthesis